jgi:hypothetical protein
MLRRIAPVVIGLVGLFFLMQVKESAQSRPFVAQEYCTGTAAPGQLWALVALAPASPTGAPTVGLGPMRCVQLDPTAFKLDPTGGILQAIPPPPPPLALVGGACTAPPVGSAPTVYAKPADGSCVPLIGMPPPGSIAGIVTATYAESAMAGQPVSLHYQFFIVGETPAPGSNLCPNPDGTLLVPCGPGQTPP